jgi:adenylate kinase
MSSDKKKSTLIEGMAALAENAANAITIVDTHLLVPIRKSGSLTVEDMWDDRMLQLFQGFVYVSARPEMIAERRRLDTERSLRILNSSPEVCAEDLRINALRWDEIRGRMDHKKVVVNDQTVLSGATKISRFIDGLM